MYSRVFRYPGSQSRYSRYSRYSRVFHPTPGIPGIPGVPVHSKSLTSVPVFPVFPVFPCIPGVRSYHPVFPCIPVYSVYSVYPGGTRGPLSPEAHWQWGGGPTPHCQRASGSTGRQPDPMAEPNRIRRKKTRKALFFVFFLVFSRVFSCFSGEPCVFPHGNSNVFRKVPEVSVRSLLALLAILARRCQK